MALIKEFVSVNLLMVICLIQPMKTEENNFSAECKNLPDFPFYKNAARGLDVTTGKRTGFPVYDVALMKGQQCKAYKNAGTWQRIPYFFYSVSPQSFTETTWREIYSQAETSDMYKKIRDLRVELGYNNKVQESGLIPVPSSFEIELSYNRNKENTRVTQTSEISYISRHIIRHHSYDIAFERIEDIKLDQRFIKDVEALPVTYGDHSDDRYQKYLKLYDTYGHLVPQRLELGGMYYYLFLIDKCSLKDSTTSSTKVGAGFKAGTDVETAVDNGIKHIVRGGLSKEDADSVLSNLTRKFTFTSEDNTVKGGTRESQLQLARGNLLYLSDWIHSLREKPEIIDGHYMFLYDLLDNEAFASLGSNATIKANLRMVMDDILKANMSDTGHCYLKCEMDASAGKCVCSCSKTANPGMGCCKPNRAHSVTLSIILCLIISFLQYFMM